LGASDKVLVRRYCAGEKEMMALIYRRYKDKVFATAYHILGNRSEAEEVLQETFLNLMRKAHTYRGQSEFSTWLYRICVNAALSWRRRLLRAGRWHYVPAAHEAQIPPPEEVERTSTLAQRDEQAEFVQQALARLSPRLRAVIVLRYMLGLSYKEVAEAVGCSIGTVKSRLNRAHRRLEPLLRESLGDYLPEGEEK